MARHGTLPSGFLLAGTDGGDFKWACWRYYVDRSRSLGSSSGLLHSFPSIRPSIHSSSYTITVLSPALETPPTLASQRSIKHRGKTQAKMYFGHGTCNAQPTFLTTKQVSARDRPAYTPHPIPETDKHIWTSHPMFCMARQTRTTRSRGLFLYQAPAPT